MNICRLLHRLFFFRTFTNPCSTQQQFIWWLSQWSRTGWNINLYSKSSLCNSEICGKMLYLCLFLTQSYYIQNCAALKLWYFLDLVTLSLELKNKIIKQQQNVGYQTDNFKALFKKTNIFVVLFFFFVLLFAKSKMF